MGLLAIPTSGAGYLAVRSLSNDAFERQLRDEVLADLKVSCPDLSCECAKSLEVATAQEYETNRLSLQGEWFDEETSSRTKVILYASRSHMSQPWTVGKLQ